MVETLTWVIGIPVIVCLAVLVVRRARDVNTAIHCHFDDQANGPVDPYADMAAAVNVQQALDDAKQRSRDSKRMLGKGDKEKHAG